MQLRTNAELHKSLLSLFHAQKRENLRRKTYRTIVMCLRRKGQTLIELLLVICALAGLALGAYYGSQWGLLGAVAGGVLGSIVGFCLNAVSWLALFSFLTWLEKRDESRKPKDKNQN